QPPRPSGRGQKISLSPVHAYAQSHNIPVYTPENFKGDDRKQEFASLNADVAIVAAYGLILPQAVLDAPKYGCINIHASLLPRWRGASPIQHAIWKGDGETGVTIMQMEKGLDTGPMLASSVIPINPSTTSEPLTDMLADLGAKMIVTVLEKIGKLTPEPQDDKFSTYAPMLEKENGKILWDHYAPEIDRQIRALNPWPGTFTMNSDKRLKILEAEPTEESSESGVGTVLDKKGLVCCGKGTLRLKRVQPDGGKPMDIAAAMNGGYLKVGDVLV
ncbi:MAG TPA: methionyl-tRNA formyltransferase, partial [Alphaproteobacteria bacterium]